MALELLTEPAVEPVSVADLKLHVRTSGTAEDALLAIYIAAARKAAEHELGRALIDQTWVLRQDEFGTLTNDGCRVSDIRLGKPKVRSITSVTYFDADGVEQTLDSSLYSLDATTQPGWLLPAYGADWPTTQDRVNAVAITFVAGYGSSADDVPSDIKAWILLTAAALYAQREALDASGRIASLPGRFVASLLDPHRVYGV